MDHTEISWANRPEASGASSASPTEKPAIEPQAKKSQAANANNATQRTGFGSGLEDLLSDQPANANKAAQHTVPKNDNNVDGQTGLPPARSLANGTELVSRSGRGGLGTLSIENGNNPDAVVKLVDAATLGRTLRCVYIRGNSSVWLTGIPQGEYRVMFTLGTDWDKVQMEFRRDTLYEEFVHNLLYQEVEKDDGTQYSNFRLTLHKVAYGNAPSRSIGRNRFGIAIPEPQR